VQQEPSARVTPAESSGSVWVQPPLIVVSETKNRDRQREKTGERLFSKLPPRHKGNDPQAFGSGLTSCASDWWETLVESNRNAVIWPSCAADRLR